MKATFEVTFLLVGSQQEIDHFREAIRWFPDFFEYVAPVIQRSIVIETNEAGEETELI